MKNLLIVAIFTLGLALSGTNAFASPDHDHGAPTFQPPKGGVLQSTHDNHFELLRKDNIVYLYAYNQDGKAVLTKDFKLTTELEIPRKKAVSFNWSDKGTHWESPINSQGSHRMTLKIKILKGKEKDSVKFTLENK
jgi:hypothetical protein